MVSWGPWSREISVDVSVYFHAVIVLGVAKSNSRSTVIDHLTKTFSADKTVAVVYFYFDYRTAQTPTDFITSLLQQLCLQSQSLPPSVARLYRKWNDGYDQSSLDVGEVAAGFFDLASKFGRTFVCLDALDECDEQYHRAIQDLIQRTMKSRCRLITSSRSNRTFKELFEENTSLEISATPRNIDEYVRSVLSSRQEISDMIDENLSEKISRTIQTKSRGL
jgi:NACHT domain